MAEADGRRTRRAQPAVTGSPRPRHLRPLLPAALLFVLAAGALSPRAVPFDMDELVAYHPLGCEAFPLSRQHNQFRAGCSEYALTPPLAGRPLPLRSFLYIGSLAVLPFLPLWWVLDDPVAVRVQGALFLLLAAALVARLARTSLPRALVAFLVLPALAGAFLVDTGPVGLPTILVLLALVLLEDAASSPRVPLRAAAAGGIGFLAFWVKPVLAWCLPALLLRAFMATEGKGRPAPAGRARAASVLAFLAAFTLPAAWLLLARTSDGVPYGHVLRLGRFSAEPASVGSVASTLLGFVWNGASFAPRVLTWPPSLLDRLPLATALGLLALGLFRPARRPAVLLWLSAAAATFAVTVLSGRALSHHHLAYALVFVALAVASSLGRPGESRMAFVLTAAALALFAASLVSRAPRALVAPRSNAAKDRLLAWVRETGRDRSTIQLHASWGTYYIAHLFGDRRQVVLFSRKFAWDPAQVSAARRIASEEGRGLLLVTAEPERLDRAVVSSLLGVPVATHRFENWWALEYAPPRGDPP